MNINSKDLSLNTPLHDALRAHSNLKTILCLIKHGADVDAQDKNGVTPRALLKLHKDIDVF